MFKTIGVCQYSSANKVLIILPDTLAIYKKHVQVGQWAVVTEVITSVTHCHISVHVGKK